MIVDLGSCQVASVMNKHVAYVMMYVVHVFTKFL